MSGILNQSYLMTLWILGQLLERPLHGYEILQKVRREPMWANLNPGGLYRILRDMERKGLVISQWSLGGGPPKRVYMVTDFGGRWFVQQRDVLKEHIQFLNGLLKSMEGGE